MHLRDVAGTLLIAPTTRVTACFDGTDRNMCTLSDIKCLSMISLSFSQDRARNTIPHSLLNCPQTTFPGHFGMKITWHLQSQVVYLA